MKIKDLYNFSYFILRITEHFLNIRACKTVEDIRVLRYYHLVQGRVGREGYCVNALYQTY